MSAMNGQVDRELDMEIVSASWLSLSESHGYDRMVEMWDRKLRASNEHERMSVADRILLRHLSGISDLLDGRTDLESHDRLQEAVEATSSPTIVLSPEGRIVTRGETAAAFFGVEQGEFAGTSWLRDDSMHDFETVRRAVHGGGNANYAIVRIVGVDGQDAIAEVYNVKAAQHEKAFTIVRSLELEWGPDIESRLEQAFGLTEAEVDICRLMLVHRDVERIAQVRDVSRETVRTQLKRVFVKTEVRSKAELVHLVGLISARASQEREKSDLAWADPLGNETKIKRANGRELAYTWTGAENGRPVLFLHGEIPYFVLPQSTRKLLADADIKLICMSTPGHGSSDPPTLDDQLEDGCNAVFELCDHLALTTIPGVASYSGQFYLARAASLRPDLFPSLLSIGLPWNLTDERWRKLALSQRTLARLALTAPDIFKFMMRIGYRLMKREGPDFYLNRALGETKVDREIILNPEFQPFLRAACRHLMCQGYEAFVREQIMVARNPMSGWFKDMQTPFHWLVPADAENIDADDIAAASALGPNVTVELVLDTGELLPYQRPNLFVERLEQLASGQQERATGEQALDAND